MLSPKDVRLVSRWSSVDTVEVVIEGLESAFDGKSSRRVTTLAYASQVVERLAKSHREKKVGTEEVFGVTGQTSDRTFVIGEPKRGRRSLVCGDAGCVRMLISFGSINC